MTHYGWQDRRPTGEPETLADAVIDKATALLAELDDLRAEYASLTDEERGRLPESVRDFFGDPRPT